MEVKSKEEQDIKIEIQKSDEIAKIEKKMKSLGYMPIHVFICGTLMALITMYYESTNISIVISFLAGAIVITSIASTQRTDLLKKLFELKYGN